jgi:hypothetical protein
MLRCLVQSAGGMRGLDPDLHFHFSANESHILQAKTQVRLDFLRSRLACILRGRQLGTDQRLIAFAQMFANVSLCKLRKERYVRVSFAREARAERSLPAILVDSRYRVVAARPSPPPNIALITLCFIFGFYCGLSTILIVLSRLRGYLGM